MKLKPLFLPYFPSNTYLETKPWHRLVEVTQFIASLVGVLFILFILGSFNTGSLQADLLIPDLLLGVILFFAINILYRAVLYISFGNWSGNPKKK